MPTLRYFKQDPSVPDLAFSTSGSACFDLRAFLKDGDIIEGFSEYGVKLRLKVEGEKLRLHPFDRVKIPTGVIFDIPEGYAVKVYPRSSVGYKKGIFLANGTGIIDSDYVDPMYLLIVNNTSTVVEVENGERICQAELVKTENVEFEILSEAPSQKGDRTGGIGSTGSK